MCLCVHVSASVCTCVCACVSVHVYVHDLGLLLEYTVYNIMYSDYIIVNSTIVIILYLTLTIAHRNQQ